MTMDVVLVPPEEVRTLRDLYRKEFGIRLRTGVRIAGRNNVIEWRAVEPKDRKEIKMKVLSRPALISFLIVLSGCVPCLYPLYTDRDVIFDPALLGVWTEPDSKETWAFTRSAEREYQLVNTDKDGKKSNFLAHLLKIEGGMFLDLFAVKPADLQDNDYLLPLHTFIRIIEIDPRPRFSYLDPAWLKQFLEKNPASIRHERVNNEILLTASPPELQKFVLAHLKTDGAFSEPTDLKRKEGDNDERPNPL
jgi:hypothetical protein